FLPNQLFILLLNRGGAIAGIGCDRSVAAMVILTSTPVQPRRSQPGAARVPLLSRSRRNLQASRTIVPPVYKRPAVYQRAAADAGRRISACPVQSCEVDEHCSAPIKPSRKLSIRAIVCCLSAR